jgi:hypothetical protein
MNEARALPSGVITADSRAILLLDDADEYLQLLLKIAKEDALGSSGLGGTERVPVVLALSDGTPARDVIAPNLHRPGWKWMELRPFNKSAEQREDMLAYARVLMNPFDPKIVKDVSDKAWFIDYSAPNQAISRLETSYSKYLKGLPSEFSDMRFYMVADYARNDGAVVEADDENALRALLAQEQQ